MGERSSVRVGDEILEFKSLNLRELMKEDDEDGIREDAAEDDSANRRQTMGSILVGDGGKTLRDAIRSDRPKARKIAGSRLLKNVFRAKKKFEEEQSANPQFAERSPSVVDSARLGGDGAATIRVFLLGRSPPDTVDGAAADPGIPWRFLRRRLGLSNMACCGSSWSEVAEQPNLNSAVPVEESDEAIGSNNSGPLQQHDGNIDGTGGDANRSRAERCVNAESGGRQPVPSPFDGNLEEPDDGSTPAGMNLGAALAAERQLRAAHGWGGVVGSAAVASSAPDRVTSGGSPVRVSLMSLLEQADGTRNRTTASWLLTDGWEEPQPGESEGVDPLCCVCMVRPKGAAFIPCGHTFCRFCTRELWISRGSCPLCNGHIVEILDIF